ncbi:lysosome membrane protein 2-like [Gigantopelta aegis]|uniref:lysosome membrane protein 2-like n=1 Tax=Gigantopelta aegis TaxID=1735272 RepID=UPI001B88885B|nr:lysosome membrane protein 2-like [Gigantopelta aegis]
MVLTLTRKMKVVCCVGLTLAVVGIVMIPVVQAIVKSKIKEEMMLKEGGMLYKIWKNFSIPIYMQIYMFNLSNPDEFKSGQKPAMVQTGPYTYREERYKINITHNANGTVTYRQIRRFIFNRTMSVGDESDLFVTINPVLMTLLASLHSESGLVREIVSFVLGLSGQDIIITRSVSDVIWGYHDPVLAKAMKIAKSWFYTDYVGYFINKNNTDDGLYTVFTGENDINKLGVINKYNGSSYVDYWSTKWANMINGSDGTIAPPFQEKTTTLPMFSSDICRSVFGVYTSDVKSPQGINLHRFTSTEDQLANKTINPANVGFCTPNTSCMGTGVLNISQCQLLDYFHIPIVVSFPHFLMADMKYLSAVDGMHPNKQEHETAVDYEPMTGLVLQAAKRLQINIYIAPIDKMKQTYNIKPVVFPVFWLNESSVVDDSHAETLQNMLFTPLLVAKVLEIVLIAGGSLLLVSGLGLAFIKRKMLGRIEPQIEPPQHIDSYDERQPLLSGSLSGKVPPALVDESRNTGRDASHMDDDDVPDFHVETGGSPSGGVN